MGGKAGRGTVHRCYSAEFYTPPEIVEGARYVLGWIDVDPHSNARAQKVVMAAVWFSKTRPFVPGGWPPWPASRALRIFWNPANNRDGSLIREAWKEANERALIHGDVVFWVGFSTASKAALSGERTVNGVTTRVRLSDGRACPPPTAWPHVDLTAACPGTTASGRVMWINGATGKPARSPNNASYLALLGGTEEQKDRFRRHIGRWGHYHAGSIALRRSVAPEILAALREFGPLPMSKSATSASLESLIGGRTATLVVEVNNMIDDGLLERAGPRRGTGARVGLWGEGGVRALVEYFARLVGRAS